MAANEILRFADNDTGTNLLTQAEYLADPQREIGNQPGIARSKLVNKALRQSSLIAAAVAQFIADNQDIDITDDLLVEDLVDYLTESLGNGLAPTLRNQVVTSLTTTGTGAAYVGTPTLALPALVANKTRFNVVFHTANTSTTPTLNISGLGAIPIKVLGAANSKVDPIVGQIPAGFIGDVVYDGASFVILSGGSGAGATGAAGNQVFFENDQQVTASYTITAGKNAVSAGPVTINVGVTVSVPVGSTWSIV